MNVELELYYLEQKPAFVFSSPWREKSVSSSFFTETVRQRREECVSTGGVMNE